MSHDEIRDSLGAYVVDAIDDIERARIDRHLADCADCRQDVDVMRSAVAQLGESTPAEPPPGFKEQVLRAVDESPRKRRTPALGWAAAIAAAVAVFVVISLPSSPSADDVLAASDARSVVLIGEGEATLTIAPSIEAAVISTNLAAPPDGHEYEMWAIDAGIATSLGILDPDGPVVVESVFSDVDAFAISVELIGHAGGPDGPIILTADL